MSLLDVKYVVTVEYCNDLNLADALAYYATEASYAAALAMSLDTYLYAPSAAPEKTGQLVRCRVIKAMYAPI